MTHFTVNTKCAQQVAKEYAEPQQGTVTMVVDAAQHAAGQIETKAHQAVATVSQTAQRAKQGDTAFVCLVPATGFMLDATDTICCLCSVTCKIPKPNVHLSLLQHCIYLVVLKKAMDHSMPFV